MQRFADHLANSYIPNTVIIDATASEVPPAQYLQWMQKGIHIITPNKKLGSGPLDQYLALRSFQRESYIHFFYEVNFFGLCIQNETLCHLVHVSELYTHLNVLGCSWMQLLTNLSGVYLSTSLTTCRVHCPQCTRFSSRVSSKPVALTTAAVNGDVAFSCPQPTWS